MPQEDELVLCTVTAVQYHSVFCTLDEYGKTGMIHISEVAPGRIRNIRDFVKEGKKIVCKVLRINQEKGHIDLSLRRVNENQKRQKLNQIKQEQLAEKIIEHTAKQHMKKPEEIYEALAKELVPKYGGLFLAFEQVSQDQLDLAKYLDKKLAADLTTAIKQRITPKEVNIDGDLTLLSYAPNGIDLVKDALQKGKDTPGKPIIRYKGAGTYHVAVTSNDYKDAEKKLKQAVDAVLETAKTHKMQASFVRAEHDK
ncbi:MAG: translation initiation factor IF-2 subunit alpha [Candidatus Woesearchaeota archaeon]